METPPFIVLTDGFQERGGVGLENRDQDMYEWAMALIQMVGIQLRMEREKARPVMEEKSAPWDIVTQLDRQVEDFLARAIQKKYPSHQILGEENHRVPNWCQSPYLWIIDPIDGTTNFYRYAKDYAISLAFYRYGEPVFGLVYDVAAQQLYGAVQSDIPLGIKTGNFGSPVPATEGVGLKQAVVGMSLRTMNDLADWGMDPYRLLLKVQAYRYMGCASLELCRVASGEYDFFIASNVYLWDIAAARVIVEHCGGRLLIRNLSPGEGGKEKLLVAAYRSPQLCEELIPYFSRDLQGIFQECFL